MLQNGDLFTVVDLKDSVRQVTDVDWRSVKIMQMSPQQYADINVGLYDDVKSSANQLDNSLKNAGFRTLYRFSYDYRIPGLSSDEIVRDAYKLQSFYKVACTYIQKTNRFPQEKVFDDAARLSYYYAQYVWAANPPLRSDYQEHLDMYYDWGRVLCFLLGVGFKFHPRDVYEFVMVFNNPTLTNAEMRMKRQEQQVFKDWCASYGVDTGCLVLSNAHRDKLRKIITKTDTPYILQLLTLPFRRR